VKAPFGKDDNDKTGNSFEITYQSYNQSENVYTVMTGLSTSAANEQAIINAVNSAYARVKPQEYHEGIYTVKAYPVDENLSKLDPNAPGFDADDVVTIAIEVTSTAGEVDLEQVVTDFSQDYLNDMIAKIDAVPGMTDSQKTAMLELVSAAAPATLFAGSEVENAPSNVIYFCSGDYYAELISSEFAALAKMASSGVTKAQMDAVLGTNWSNYVSNFFADCTYPIVNSASGTIVAASTTFNSAADFITAANDVLTMDLGSDPVLKAIVDSGFAKGWIEGTYNFSIDVAPAN
jgi:hypothetical protein